MSASKHNRSGHSHHIKREKPIAPNLIEFLEKRGLYQRGKVPLDFRNKISTTSIRYRFPLLYENQTVN